MPEQLLLAFPQRPALGRDDFLIAPSNAAAVALVDRWPQWPTYEAIIAGAPGTGKSHLAAVWQQKSGANSLEHSELSIGSVPKALAATSLVVENVNFATGSETALFHLLNLAREKKAHVLLTIQNWPLQVIRLPDLQTRLHSLPYAVIQQADDALLRGVLAKLFADRQMPCDDALLTYLINHMPRSLQAARQFVEVLDTQSLQQGVAITRAFVARVLARFESPDLL